MGEEYQVSAHTRPPKPPQIEPFCVATVHEIGPVGPNQATLKIEVQGHPDHGGAYYWTPAQARAVFLALRNHNVLGDK